MNRMPGAVGVVGGLLTILVLLLAAPAQAHGIVGDAGRSAGAGSECRIVASVIGGAAGLLLGAALGASLERAAYGGNPDAGLTGGLVGAVVGGVAGAGLARKACDQSSENQLRAHLSPMREFRPLGVQIHRGESEGFLQRPVPRLPLARLTCPLIEAIG